MNKGKVLKSLLVIALATLAVTAIYFITTSNKDNTSEVVDTEITDNVEETVEPTTEVKGNGYAELLAENDRNSDIENGEVEQTEKDITFADVTSNLNNIVTNRETETKLELDTTSQEVSSVALAIDNDTGKAITRYQFADILYKIIESQGKLPNITGYQITYKDSGELETKYMQVVCYTSYLQLYAYGLEFNGYKFVTKAEAEYSFGKLQEYLDNYTEAMEEAPDLSEDPLERDEEALKLEAEVILKDRKFEDKLTGQSVAVFSAPRTLHELEVNQESILKADLIELNNRFEYGSTDGTGQDIVNIEYINLDQGLLDYSVMSHRDQSNTLGITYVEGMKFEPIDNNENMIYRCKDMDTLAIGPLFSCYRIFIINNNKIVQEVMGLSENGVTGIMVDKGIEFDSVGFLVAKDVIENVDLVGTAFEQEGEQTYVLAITKLK